MSGKIHRGATVRFQDCVEVETSRIRLGAAIIRIGRLVRLIEATYQEIEKASNDLDSRLVREKFEFLERKVRRAEIELAINRERIREVREALSRIRARTPKQ
jgi:hypothetical protein